MANELTVPEIPLPLSSVNASMGKLATVFLERKYCTIARESGCVEEFAKQYSASNCACVKLSPKYSTCCVAPVVSVPVLSKTISVTLFSCSIIAVFFKYRPFLPSNRITFPKVKGADKASAQGQATINIATIIWVMRDTSINAQAIAEMEAIIKIMVRK